jgi:predicted DNA repair protein MutK
MSGLLALLDDVAAIAKVAAASVDDVVGQAAKAGSKAAGAMIDDAAVTPKYLHGFDASRELPIVWRIAKGSLKNKLLYLLPVGLALSALAPWAIPPLLMLGGAYLCFEGAEKIVHVLFPHADHAVEADFNVGDPAHLEERKAAGAIKTDFILSAEIMTISLAEIPKSTLWVEGAVLAVVGVAITVIVYGGVALIVKADDVGLHMAEHGRWWPTRRAGQGIVRAMPGVLKALTIVGTAAMLWVGGAIITHGLEQLGQPMAAHLVGDLASAGAAMVPQAAQAAANWTIAAGLNAVAGLALGLVLVPVATRAIVPAWQALTGGRG